MEQLLLDQERSLRSSQPEDEVRTRQRARTLTILGRLDPDRKRSVLQFVYELGLISKEQPTLRLADADLSNANLARLNLIDANLNGARLNGVDLSDAHLCVFHGTGETLLKAEQLDTYAHNLMEPAAATSFMEADLRNAYLRGATLAGCDFFRADLSDADLDGADLRGAKLGSARGLTQKQIDLAYGTYQQESVADTELPDHLKAPAAWSKFINEQKRDRV